jgi:1-acyl-sn-glycerol-3-phosphate acyltransferase
VNGVYRGVNGIGRLMLRALDISVHASGQEFLPASGPVILAANHVSYPDFVFIEKAAVDRGRYVRFMTRHDAWLPGPVAWAMDAMQHVPVDRAAPAGAYLRARRLLRQGEAVGIFPEAGISYSYTVRSLMRGAAALAAETGAPIVPAAIWGSQRIYSVGVPEPAPDLTRGRRIDVMFGEPMRLAPGTDPTVATIALGHRLTAMLEDLQQRPEHRPRPGEYATWYPAHLGGRAPSRTVAQEHDVVPSSAITPTWGPGFPHDAHQGPRCVESARVRPSR